MFSRTLTDRVVLVRECHAHVRDCESVTRVDALNPLKYHKGALHFPCHLRLPSILPPPPVCHQRSFEEEAAKKEAAKSGAGASGSSSGSSGAPGVGVKATSGPGTGGKTGKDAAAAGEEEEVRTVSGVECCVQLMYSKSRTSRMQVCGCVCVAVCPLGLLVMHIVQSKRLVTHLDLVAGAVGPGGMLLAGFRGVCGKRGMHVRSARRRGKAAKLGSAAILVK
jgi:hypothetical protein